MSTFPNRRRGQYCPSMSSWLILLTHLWSLTTAHPEKHIHPFSPEQEYNLYEDLDPILVIQSVEKHLAFIRFITNWIMGCELSLQIREILSHHGVTCLLYMAAKSEESCEQNSAEAVLKWTKGRTINIQKPQIDNWKGVGHWMYLSMQWITIQWQCYTGKSKKIKLVCNTWNLFFLFATQACDDWWFCFVIKWVMTYFKCDRARQRDSVCTLIITVCIPDSMSHFTF